MTNTKMIRTMMILGAGLFAVTLMAAGDANAAAGDTNFSSIASNMTLSISRFPTLISGLAYLFGLLLAVLGVMKIKDHVENPGQTPLKDGSIRLAAGGGLFAIPMVSNAMTNTIGSDAALTQVSLTSVNFN